MLDKKALAKKATKVLRRFSEDRRKEFLNPRKGTVMLGNGEANQDIQLDPNKDLIIMGKLDASGSVVGIRLVGPIHNKAYCYGLLGLAHDVVSKFDPREQANKPIAASEADLKQVDDIASRFQTGR